MFSSSLCASLIALIASAVSVSATPSLAVRVSTPGTRVDGLENLKVTTAITNTGDETLRLINDPRGVLDPFPEDSFIIINAAGSRPLFDGATVKFSPAYAASLDDPDGFTILASGAHINVTHDLSIAYDFTQSGTGDYTIEPSNLFVYVDADGAPRDLFATVENAAEVELSGNLAVPRDHDKRVNVDTCSPDRQLWLYVATTVAQDYAKDGYNYLQSLSSGTDLYTTWFGYYTTGRKNIVQGRFKLINGNQFSTFTYDCTCTKPNTFAYVKRYKFGIIYLCGAFWKAPLSGIDSMGGTILHEASHFVANGAAKDYAYSPAKAKKLAKNNPDQAVNAADNYEYFVESMPSSP